jgi:hypothetical protein
VLLTVPAGEGAAAQPLVSYSVDRVIVPPGHTFVAVLYFEPISPGPHEVIVLSMGILYGTQAVSPRVCADALPAVHRANSTRIFPIIFKEAPFF